MDIINNIPVVSNFVKFFEELFNGSNEPPFVMYFMDELNVSNPSNPAIKFTALIKGDGYKNSMEVSEHPMIGANVGVTGFYKTEGASFTLDLAVTCPTGESETISLYYMESLNSLKGNPKNLYIPQQFNMPKPEYNVRLMDINPYDRDQLDIFRVKLLCKNLMPTASNTQFAQSKPRTDPTYTPAQGGTTSSKNIPVEYK